MSLVDTIELDHIFLIHSANLCLLIRVFPGNCQKNSENGSSPGLGLVGSSKILLSPVAARLLIFTAPFVVTLLDFKTSEELGRGRCYEAS